MLHLNKGSPSAEHIGFALRVKSVVYSGNGDYHVGCAVPSVTAITYELTEILLILGTPLHAILRVAHLLNVDPGVSSDLLTIYDVYLLRCLLKGIKVNHMIGVCGFQLRVYSLEHRERVSGFARRHDSPSIIAVDP